MSLQLNKSSGCISLGDNEDTYRLRIVYPLGKKDSWVLKVLDFKSNRQFLKELSYDEALNHPALQNAITQISFEDQTEEIGDLLLNGFASRFPWKCEFKFVGKLTPSTSADKLIGFSSYHPDQANNLMLRLSNAKYHSSGWFLLECVGKLNEGDILDEQLLATSKAIEREIAERTNAATAMENRMNDLEAAIPKRPVSEDQITQIVAEIADLRKNAEFLARQLQMTKEQDLKRLEDDFTDFQQAFQSKVDALTNDLTDLRSKIAALTQQVTQLSQDFQSSQDQKYGGQFDGSAILTEQMFKRRLVEWTYHSVGDSKWKLLWKSTFTSNMNSAFHASCDNKGSTLVVIRGNSFIFGGFASWSWTQNGAAVHDPHAFIFSLKNPQGTPPVKFPSNNGTGTVYHHASYGPAFGPNPDLSLAANGTVNFNFSECFSVLRRVTSTQPNNFFTGSTPHQIQDIEVFYLPS